MTAKNVLGVTCTKQSCGHVTYFDLSEVCPEDSQTVIRRTVIRGKEGQALDVLYLKCEKCGEPVVVEVDCKDYK